MAATERTEVGGARSHQCFAIGDLSRITGVNIATIRYYERMGLMPRPPRTQGGHRSFGPEELRTLGFIRRGRELGFCLEDVRALLSLRGADRPCVDAKAIATRHLDDVRAKLRHFAELERTLADAVTRCPGDNAADCTLLDMLESRPSGRTRPRAERPSPHHP